MVKQVKIFEANSIENLEREINKFCVDFFPEEIFSIKILPLESEGAYFAYITYQKDEYEES
ncbi:hypothetical protein DCO58_02445 [Helicobacter saguini]|uniref:Uncharacterized protein n=1 Tax=Helicobacter saguini TaxID=1548018 RepID=A0A347VRV3_9HELI|nr:hypothetical protein [Helicobacter saguini]MWV62763.1 hypothetical protein [Helicobacter saguini]MWV66567.1 hypothetical protein [Helicobacter saguini]MWV68917.1 hypothetical protein [Helicobacter saguini]MWV71529.1 hypothetical protein [Helicobacter saguini]TLD93626.1 hypothetical protein LS64_008330 [Helicobacter saguini]